MNNPQEILIELIEGQDSQGISELLEQHPDLERDYKAYSEIIKAFKAMRVDQLSQKLESDQTISFEDDLQKGMQAMKVEALTEKLKLHDTKEKTTSSRIIRLNTRILSIAASFLILVSVAFWVFNDSASALGVEDVAQAPIALNIRATDTDLPVNVLNRLSIEKDWSGLIESYTAIEGETSIIEDYHYAYALFMIKEYDEAASLFNSLISSESFQWSEMAEYNYMLCLYALGDPDYSKIQEEINSSEEHSMKKRMAEFEKLISE